MRRLSCVLSRLSVASLGIISLSLPRRLVHHTVQRAAPGRDGDSESDVDSSVDSTDGDAVNAHLALALTTLEFLHSVCPFSKPLRAEFKSPSNLVRCVTEFPVFV